MQTDLLILFPGVRTASSLYSELGRLLNKITSRIQSGNRGKTEAKIQNSGSKTTKRLRSRINQQVALIRNRFHVIHASSVA